MIYLRQRAALAARSGDMIDITPFGAPVPEYADMTPGPWDYASLARAAYLRGDITVEAFEHVLDIELGLRDGDLCIVAAAGPEWIIPTGTLKR